MFLGKLISDKRWSRTRMARKQQSRRTQSIQFTFRIEPAKMLPVFGSYFISFLFLGLCLADVFDECTDGINLSFIASTKSCAHYIFCNGDESYDGECEDGEYFSADMEMCEPMGTIDCRTGLPIAENNINSSTEVNSNVTGGFGNSSSTSTVVNTTLAPTSVVVTLRPSINETGTTPTILSPSIDVIVANMCPQLDNQSRIVLLPNQNSCSDYYICYRGESLPMSCAATLHFNSRTGKCDHPENVRCMVGNNVHYFMQKSYYKTINIFRR